MRRFFTPAWLALHALAMALFGAFLALGWWQLERAGAGNMRSWGYAFEWPVFALFVLAMWVKMIHDELTGNTGQRGATGEDHDGAPGPESGGPGWAGGGASGGMAGRRRETGADDADDADEMDEELAAYNRYLARLDAEARYDRR